MSIFTKSNGSVSTATSYSTGKKFKLIPDDTQVLCEVVSVDETENNKLNRDYEKQGETFLKISLLVSEGTYEDTELSQKIYINANDDVIRDRSVDLLSVYNSLSENKLSKLSSKLKSLDQLTDDILSRAIVGVELIATVGLINGSEYKDRITGEIKIGRDINFVKAVNPIDNKHNVKSLNKDPGNVKSLDRDPGEDDDLDEEIPF